MKRLIEFYRKNNSIINFYVLIAFVISLIWSYALNSIAITILAIVGILNYFFVKDKVLKVSKTNSILIVYYIIILINTLCHNAGEGTFKIALKYLPFLIFPLVGTLISISTEQKRKILSFYVAVIFTYCLMAIGYQFYYWHKIGNEVWLDAGGWAFFAWNLPFTFDFHAPYLGMYVSMAILIILKNNNWLIKFQSYENVVQYVVLLFFVLFLFFIGVKNAIIFNSLLIIGVLCYNLSKSNYLPAIAMLLIGFICLFIIPKNYLNNRINGLIFTRELKKVDPIRYDVNKTHMELAVDYFVFGTGVKNYEQITRDNYFQKGFKEGYNQQLNAHNQYLQSAVTLGIFGLTLLVATIILGFNESIRSKDLLFTLFICLVVLAMFTESIFVRQRGIVFFAFFYVFLSKNNFKAIRFFRD